MLQLLVNDYARWAVGAPRSNQKPTAAAAFEASAGGGSVTEDGRDGSRDDGTPGVGGVHDVPPASDVHGLAHTITGGSIHVENTNDQSH